MVRTAISGQRDQRPAEFKFKVSRHIVFSWPSRTGSTTDIRGVREGVIDRVLRRGSVAGRDALRLDCCRERYALLRFPCGRCLITARENPVLSVAAPLTNTPIIATRPRPYVRSRRALGVGRACCSPYDTFDGRIHHSVDERPNLSQDLLANEH